MTWARRHARLLSALAFCLLALATEIVGRALIASVDVGRHVGSPADASADYYPFLLAGVKVGIALLLARLAWRVVKARATASAAERVLGVAFCSGRPRPRLRLSPRLWLGFFVVTSLIYLVQTEAEFAAAGRWQLIAPWLHSSALPVFAVLAVALAILWQAVQRWLAEYERYADAVAERARRGLAPRTMRPSCAPAPVPPRRLFGLSFESRPPPLPA